jgi:hypothetical protein
MPTAVEDKPIKATKALKALREFLASSEDPARGVTIAPEVKHQLQQMETSLSATYER